MTRWSLVVDENTDRNLRAYLGQQGAKKGDLSKFVEEAVQQRLFNDTVNAVKFRNAELDQDIILNTVNEVVEAVRADCS